MIIYPITRAMRRAQYLQMAADIAWRMLLVRMRVGRPR